MLAEALATSRKFFPERNFRFWACDCHGLAKSDRFNPSL